MKRTMNETTAKAKQSPSPIPLRHVKYQASITGSFAQVVSSQAFENTAKKPVEAVYAFPMPDDASVTGCVMQVGHRKVVAELKKSREARQEYDEAVSAGHHASLLEQERPNIFTMNVGGIEPGEKITVRITYVQRIPWQGGGARFRIPLVVAPQFIPGAPVAEAKKGGGWSPDTDEVPDASRITPVVAKEGVGYDADIEISFAPGFRCKLVCPSHPMLVEEQTVAKSDTVALTTGDIRTDRDFTLAYQSLSKIAEVAAHAHSLDDESFLLASIIPPGEVKPVASDVVFVLDCSGSMDGAKIDGLKRITKKAVRILGEEKIGHRIGIQPFDSQPWPAFKVDDITEGTEKFIDGLEARGGTELGSALNAAEQLFDGSGRPKVILMVTDGDTEAGKDWRGNGIRLIALGIDTAANDSRINELARRNNGTAEFIMPGEEHDAVVNRLVGYLSGPVLREVKVEAKGDVVGVTDVFEGRPATISVRFKGATIGAMKLSGKNQGGKDVSWEIDSEGAKECIFAPQLWAREFIREQTAESEQVEASLKYKVICQHTSFVAISEKEVPGKKPERIEIPVNLPAGWSFEAVFGPPVGAPMRRGSMRGIGGGSVKYCFAAGLVGDSSIDSLGATLGSVEADEVQVRGDFMPDAADPVERLVAALVALDSGDRAVAESIFETVLKDLTLKHIRSMDEVERLKAYYFVLRLASYGLRFSRDVLDALAKAPASRSTAARAWYNLASRENGVQADPVSVNKDAGGAEGYIGWKFGRCERPTGLPWSQVP